MNEKNQYQTVAAALLLVIIITVLLSPPEVLMQRGVIVDISSSYTTNDKEWVRTEMPLGDNEIIKELPMDIDVWSGYNVEVKPDVIKALNPDMIMKRVYYSPEIPEPIWLLIIRSQNTSSFHDPEICYRGIGWSVVNKQQCEITLNGSIWTADTSYKENKDITVSVNELLIEKDGRQRLIKYFYLKELVLASSPGSITIVRAEMNVEDHDETSLLINDFYSEMLPYLFEPVGEGGSSVAVVVYEKYGLVGAIVEVLLVLLPLVYIWWLAKKNQ